MGAATATAEATSGVSGTGRRVPWYLWVSALAVTSAYVGGYWDISWHRSIGRDSFWSRAAHRDLRLRRARRHLLGVPDFLDHLRPECGAARRQRPHLGAARTARRVHLGVGRRRDARLGAVRRLVAQRLRPRRENHQPAAHGARRRILRHRARHGDAAAGVHEPRVRTMRAPRCSGCSSTSAARRSASRCC